MARKCAAHSEPGVFAASAATFSSRVTRLFSSIGVNEARKDRLARYHCAHPPDDFVFGRCQALIFAANLRQTLDKIASEYSTSAYKARVQFNAVFRFCSSNAIGVERLFCSEINFC
jgi:hypothetical protein